MSVIHRGDWQPVPGEPGSEFRVVCRVTPVDGQAGVVDYEACVEVRRASEGSEDAVAGASLGDGQPGHSTSPVEQPQGDASQDPGP